MCHGESFALTLERKLRQRVKRNIPHWEIYEPFFQDVPRSSQDILRKQQGREGFLGLRSGILMFIFFPLDFFAAAAKCEWVMRWVVKLQVDPDCDGVGEDGGDCWSFFVAHNRLPSTQPP